MWNAQLVTCKLKSRLPGEISITSDMQITPHLWQKEKRNERASWWKWKRSVKKLAYYSTFNKLRSWLQSHHFKANSWGNNENSEILYFGGLQNHCRWWLQPWNQKPFAPERKAMTNLDRILKNRDIALSTEIHLVKAMVFPVVMWELDYKESWVPKNWCFCTAVLEKTPESLLVGKEIQPVHPKGNQSWIFIGRTDAEAETPILWPSNVKNTLIRKDPDAGKHWRRREKGTAEGEMVGWCYRLNGHEFE